MQNIHTAAVTSIIDLQDGELLATASYDRTIQIANYRTSAIILQVNSNQSPVSSMVLTAHKLKLITGGLDSTINVWNISKTVIIHNI